MSTKGEESTREGGREAAKPLTSGISEEALAARNSSGSASLAANILDLRLKLNFALEVIEDLCGLLAQADLRDKVHKYRQQGHRSNLGPRRLPRTRG